MRTLALAVTSLLGVLGAASQASAAFSIDFTAPQSSVSFQLVSFSSVLANAYDGATLVSSVGDNESFPITGQVDTLSGSGITSVIFEFNGGYNGPAITNLSFGSTTIDFSAVPVGSSVGSSYAGDGVIFRNAVVGQCAGGCPAPNVNGEFVYSGSGPVPEPVSWALMLVGFGAVGAVVRRSKALGVATAA